MEDDQGAPGAERIEALSQMAQGISSANNLREVFRALFLFAAQATPADGIFVTLYDPQESLRRCVYAAGLSQDDEGQSKLEEDEDLSIYPEMALNASPQSRAIVTGEVVNTPDFAAVAKGLERVDSGSDFESRPPRSSLAVPFSVEDRVLGAFEVQSTRKAAFGEGDVPALRMAAKLAAIAVHNLELREGERLQHEAVLRSLGLALEYRDYETKGHTDRVVRLSLAFGRALELGEDDLEALRWGAYLHDIGKVAIPDRILLKPGPLTSEEFAEIRRHTLIGIDMCREMPFLSTGTREVIRSHHERWDGSGYPDHLFSEEIPLLARVFSLVDVYDSLSSQRPYKRAWEHREVVAELTAQAGRQFDPELVRAFLALVEAEREVPRCGAGGSS